MKIEMQGPVDPPPPPLPPRHVPLVVPRAQKFWEALVSSGLSRNPNTIRPRGLQQVRMSAERPQQRCEERGPVRPQSSSPLELAGGAANSALRRESQGSLNSSASLDLGYLAFASKSEVSQLLGEAV